MSMYHNRPIVADMRAMKARGQKISMLYVTNFEEAAAAAAAGINMLSIEGRFMSPEMREGGDFSFRLVTLWAIRRSGFSEDYLRAAFHSS